MQKASFFQKWRFYTRARGKPPWRNQVCGLFYTVKMHTTRSFAVNAKNTYANVIHMKEQK